MIYAYPDPRETQGLCGTHREHSYTLSLYTSTYLLYCTFTFFLSYTKTFCTFQHSYSLASSHSFSLTPEQCITGTRNQRGSKKSMKGTRKQWGPKKTMKRTRNEREQKAMGRCGIAQNNEYTVYEYSPLISLTVGSAPSALPAALV